MPGDGNLLHGKMESDFGIRLNSFGMLPLISLYFTELVKF